MSLKSASCYGRKSVWHQPAATALKALPPATRTGTRLPVSVPSPSWPSVFVPCTASEQPWVQPRPPCTYVAGTTHSSATHNGPSALTQQATLPFFSRPHEKLLPGAMSTNVRPPRTTTGARLLIIVPSPNCPAVLIPAGQRPCWPVNVQCGVTQRNPRAQ